MGDTVSRVEYHTSSLSRSVKRADRLHADIEAGDVEGLEHDAGHFLAVLFWVERRFRKENGMLIGSHAQLVVESVVPYFLHVVPILHNSVFDGLIHFEDAALLESLASYIDFVLVKANHNAFNLGSAHYRAEDGAGCVVTSQASLNFA